MRKSKTSFISVDCHAQHHLCSHRGQSILKNTGHHVRAKTNQPIFGVLTQPLPDEWDGDSLESTYTSFFEASHADFLQAAGARVVPINYKADSKTLNAELASLNGVYIPGDSKESFENNQYLTQVSRIMQWVSEHNL